jgi:hypothetical protein
MKKNFYTYVYFDPRDLTPIYVGKGCSDRAMSHLKKNTHLGNVLRKRLSEGYSATPHITYHADEETAFGIEKFWIMYFGRADLGTGSLFNLTDGGEGCCGLIHSVEARKNMSSAQKGRTISEEHKAKLAAAKIGKPQSFAHIAKRVAAYRGIPCTEETKAKISKANKGKIREPYTAERREKISASLMGRIYSEETKARMSLAAKNRKKKDVE